MTERKISGAQLALLLFLCSLSTVLNGVTLLEAAAYPLGMAAVWLALSPGFSLQRRKGLLSALGRTGKWAVIPAAALLALFCAAMAAVALGNFAFFMTATVYPTARAGIFLICTAGVCAYTAGMGLEPLARMGLWAAVLAAVTLAAVAAGLGASMDAAHFVPPIGGGAGLLLRGAWRYAAATGEAVLFLLLIPRARGRKAGRAAAGWLILSAAAAAAVGLIVTAALGPYAASRRFPLHTAAAAAHFSPQGRMDLLYLVLYVFAAFTRISLWLYGGCLCLRRLFPRMRRGICAPVCAAAAALFSFLPPVYGVMDRLLSGWVLALAALVPAALLIGGLGKGETR